MNQENKVLDCLLWLSVWDAFWVPYEFKEKEEIKNIISDKMIWYWTWNEPAWSWSDDSSLSFCLAESLIEWYDLQNIASKIIDWHEKAIWTETWRVFDIWFTTIKWISILQDIFSNKDFEALYYLKNEASEDSNWNGGLMRILPLLFTIRWGDINNQFKKIWEVSALTHWHIRSAISCLIYIKLAEYILNWYEKYKSYKKTQEDIKKFFINNNIEEKEIKIFSRVIYSDISKLDIDDIKSSWYVIDTLEASLYTFLNTESYKDSIIESVKLWWDTDTVASIVWWITWLYYWSQNIPKDRLDILKRKDDIIKLANEYNKIVSN